MYHLLTALATCAPAIGPYISFVTIPSTFNDTTAFSSPVIKTSVCICYDR